MIEGTTPNVVVTDDIPDGIDYVAGSIAVVVNGATLVEGPYTAETFPVRIEDSYVVVEA